jgi:sugar/nucleoside kinase (ribokinase family)
MSILIVGTVAIDTVQTSFGKAKNVLGGSASYAAVSASFFAQVKLISVVGKDFPRKYIHFFQTRKINCKGLQIKKGKTFRWSGYYGKDINNAQTLKTELNLLAHFYPHINSNYKNEKFIFLANIDPEIQLQALSQLNSPQLIVSDTMNYWIENKKNLLKQVIKRSDILIINDAEAQQFSQQSNLIHAAKTLLDLGPRLIIIKRGEYGCILFGHTFSFCIPAYLLENVLDPTGAGDTFAGGFLGYLSQCPKITPSTIKKAVVVGTIMSSYVIEDFSLNRLKKLKKIDIKRRLKNFHQLTQF